MDLNPSVQSGEDCVSGIGLVDVSRVGVSYTDPRETNCPKCRPKTALDNEEHSKIFYTSFCLQVEKVMLDMFGKNKMNENGQSGKDS